MMIEKRGRILITLVVFSILIVYSAACGETTTTSEIKTTTEATQSAQIHKDATPTPMISDDLIDKVDKMVYWYGGGQVIYEITVTEDLAKIIVENESHCRNSALRHFNNIHKINAIILTAKDISSKGFTLFKANIHLDPLKMLQSLPYIGPVTCYHLAKNIGCGCFIYTRDKF